MGNGLGEVYHSIDLEILSAFINLFFDLPKLEYGFEAFAQFSQFDPLSIFEGWTKIGRLNDDLTFSPFQETDYRELLDFGKHFDCGTPSVYLVWENCD